MSVRYLIAPHTPRAQDRLAEALLSELAKTLTLKLEYSQPAQTPVPAHHYALRQRLLLQPRIQLWSDLPTGYRPHPLQWNILWAPPLTASLPDCDEVWVHSPAEQAHWQAQAPACTVTLLPAAAAVPVWPEASARPVEISEPQVVLAASADRDPELLAQILTGYLTACGQQEDSVLVLHLSGEHGDPEALLLSQLEARCAELQLRLDSLNIATWIGPLESAAYLACLQRAQVLLSPATAAEAHEARAAGKAVLGFDPLQGTPCAWQAEDLTKALQTSSAAEAAPDLAPDFALLADVIRQRVQHLLDTVDFAAREARWRAEQARQAEEAGRKQKYSLFHSDYNSQEMASRRQWHLRYAKLFQDAPGDVLDIGCGSGIFLELMRELQLPACGIDPDPDMVRVCQELGLEALAGDERLLQDFQPESLGGIHASHIIEHIDGDRAIALIENARQVLRPGGLLVIRTPNWRNASVRHEGFWLDITHVRPYPLPLLKQVLEDAGFEIAQAGFEEFGWNDTYLVARQPGG